MAFSLRCPICRGKFAWDPVEGMPDKCKLCGGKVGHDRDDDDIVMPFIRTNRRSKSIDQVYRDIEHGSEVRAQAAAEMTGAPVSEMSSLKITDMRDNQRPGDTVLPEANNPVSQLMAANPQVSGFGSQMGLELSRNVMVGPGANTGARMRTSIQNMHQDMVRQHCVGVDADTRRAVLPSTDVVSERPANETFQPGYRRRG